jgi:glycosyltransferase involved in cell wall biosynthesis
MNVCLFTDSFLPKIGGMELAVHYLADTLCKRGCRVTVIAKYSRGEIPFAHRYTLRQYGNRFAFSGRSGWDALAGITTLLRAHHRDPFDLVNSHGASLAGSRAYLAKKSGLLKAPWIVTPHGEDVQVVPEVNYGIRLKPKWDRIVRRNLQAADHVTAISTSILRQLEFIPDDKISTIPNGIHWSEFAVGKSDCLQRHLGLSAEDTIVLSVGRNRRVKGYEYGVRAFAAIRQKWPECPLKYVVIGKKSDELQPLIRNMNLQGVVFTIPQMSREQIVQAYASAWCFLSPSLSEGLSLVSIEAIACGLPLVVTNVPGNMDIVKDNGCGIIVKAKNPDEIARGLTHLLEHPLEYALYKRRALERAPAYDWTTIADRYIEVYRQVTTRNQRSINQLQAAT